MKTCRFVIFVAVIASMCMLTAVCAPANSLTIINRIYKIIWDGKESGEAGKSKEAEESKNEESGEAAAGQEQKYIALTFDDGPHPRYTGQILDILEAKKAPATFFIVGNRAELNPTLVRRIKSAECEIGNHTHEHVDLSKISRDEFLKQMDKCNEVIYNATGCYPKVYRPPFGRISKAHEHLISDRMRKILWTVDSHDWKTSDKDRIVKHVVSSAKDKAIILMHDFYSQTVEALPGIIDGLEEQGYKFVTVSELIEMRELPERMERFMN